MSAFEDLRATYGDSLAKKIEMENRIFRRFFLTLNTKIEAKALPEALKTDPNIVGNFVHQVVDGVSVYAISCKEHSGEAIHLKIGVAKNIRQRVNGLSTGCPLRIRKALYFCTKSDGAARVLESAIHKRLEKHHSKLEWFRFDSHSEYADAVSNLTEFVMERMGDEFNINIFDYEQDFNETAKIALVFVQSIWNASVEAEKGALRGDG